MSKKAVSGRMSGKTYDEKQIKAMFNKLTPLEAFEELKYYGCGDVYYKAIVDKDLSIIETALKNYEELTSKPVILYGRTNGHTKALVDMISKNYKEIKITNLDDEKKLKALEIIKEKEWFDDFMKEHLTREWFTKDELDLLKEVLL